MKDTDKVTLTLGQLKRLVQESKINEVRQSREDPDFCVIQWKDVIDFMKWYPKTKEDLEEMAEDSSDDVDRFLDEFDFPENGEYAEDALQTIAKELLKGKTIAMLRREYKGDI
jgi:hypothetical protein